MHGGGKGFPLESVLGIDHDYGCKQPADAHRLLGILALQLMQLWSMVG